ncbi:hypothetical protein ACFYNX_31075 [Streptomyces sp. NPDC007872]|uniref:hypothetical protein n=1 Tax=Streptomyces sp. NPDC007872 TaxID=3364782 RepID=UPI00367E36A4
MSTATRLQPHRLLEARIDRAAHDSRVDLSILEEAAPHAPQPPMEIQAPVAGSLLFCRDLGVGRDSGAPVTPRTVHQNLIEEVISVLAFPSISKPVAGRLYIPAHLVSLPEPAISLVVGTDGLLPPQQGPLD